MVSRRFTLMALAATALAMPVGALLPLEVAAASKVLVIVTRPNTALNDLSLRDLKRLYQAEPMTGTDGSRLIPLNQAVGSAPRVAFDQRVLKMSPDQVGRFWIDRKIRGEPGAPRAIPSADLLRRLVVSLAGTVAYIDAAEVTADLKVLTIDGKRPTDAGYPLTVE